MHRFLRNFKLLSGIGFLLLIGTLWFFGYAFGLSSVEERLTAIIIVMVIWVVGLLIGRLLAMRAGSLVDRMFRAQLDKAVMQATPEQRGEVALLRKQLLEAIATLKKSNLGRTRGKAALYELPWYMIIGHPAAGKSSAIQNSELVFPLAENGKNAIRGVGGTRNCDWFFTTEGVLLDTAGRYSTQREDRAEWLEFLRLLKTHRSRTPVNGILVAISFPELVQFRSEGFAEYARQIRARINEIDQAFSRKVPVYLLFTKVDLLGGFTQFFADMTDAQRMQVWGATVTHEQSRDFDAAATVAAEFEELYRGLAEIGSEKLAGNRNNINKPALFAFPIEFNAMRAAVVRFVEILFEDDPYHTRPLLRGFYFTSALQEGAPNIPAGLRVSSKFDLANNGFPAVKAGGSHSFFLRDLFRDVIFPDQHLIGRQVKNARSRTRWAGLAAGILAAITVIGAWGYSYYENRKFVSDAMQEISLFESPQLSDRLARLNFVQLRLDQLEQYRKEGHPVSMGFGLYQGDKLEIELRHIYVAEVSDLFLEPLKKNLESRLGRLASDPKVVASSQAAHPDKVSNEQYYDILKTYLMLHEQDRLEPVYFSEKASIYWRDWLDRERGAESMESIEPLSEHIISYYVAHFNGSPAVDNDERLIAESREFLNGAMRKLSAKERIYNEIIALATSKYTSLDVPRILENADADLISGSYRIPAAFTRAAYEGQIQSAITEASRGTLKDNDWVLGSGKAAEQLSPADFEKNRDELLGMYKVAYSREWMKFIAGLSINNFRGLDDAVSRVGRLSDLKMSPVRRVFSRIAYETSWDDPRLLKAVGPKPDQNIKEAIVNRLLATNEGSSSAGQPNQYGEIQEKFSLFDRMTSEQKGTPTISAYLTALAKLKTRLEVIASSGEQGKSARSLMKSTIDASGSELNEGVQVVEGQLLSGADSEMRELLRPVLVRPFTSSYGVLLPLANSDINQLWQRQVFPYWQLISDKYPFANSGTEVELADVFKFLGREDATLNKFLNESLDGLLTRNGNVYVPRRWGNMSVPFNNAFLTGIAKASNIEERVLIAGGESRFELQPVPTPGLSEVMLEIDGQQVRYRNGPQLWSAFSWPSSQNNLGAKVSVVTFSGIASTVLNHPGRMGWVRLVSEARVAPGGTGMSQLVWMVDTPGNKGGEKMAIRFNLRLVSGSNPLAINTLGELSLPKRIVN